MVDDKSWSKVDPRDAQLLAPATQVAELKAAKADGRPTPSANTTNGKENDLVGGSMPKWRTVKDGLTKIVDGKTWHWCSQHHHKDNLWNGLYVSHPENEHAEITAKWKRLNNKKKGEAKENAANATDSSKETPAPENPSLDLSSRLKDVLCTNLCLSAEDAQKLIDQASGN